MSNMDKNQSLNEELKEDKITSKASSSRGAYHLLCIFGAVVLLAGLFVGVFFLRTKQIDSTVSSMKPFVDIKEDKSSANMKVKSVKVFIDDKEYKVKELEKLDNLPEVVEVKVSYEGGTSVSKQAYISYSSVDSIEYKDGPYGRFLLPLELHKKITK
jgi:hypothetical protein